jgi:hypothetical protein
MMNWYVGKWFLAAGEAIRIGVVIEYGYKPPTNYPFPTCHLMGVRPTGDILPSGFGELIYTDPGVTLMEEAGVKYTIYWITVENKGPGAAFFGICGTRLF